MLYCLFFQDLKVHRFLDVCFNFQISWRLFKSFISVGPSLDLSCLMPSVFIITLIIRIIKTKCFSNIFWWRNLKVSFLKEGSLFLPLTSPVLVIFTRLLACNFKKVCSTSVLKSFYGGSYTFLIITHLLMYK